MLLFKSAATEASSTNRVKTHVGNSTLLNIDPTVYNNVIKQKHLMRK